MGVCTCACVCVREQWFVLAAGVGLQITVDDGIWYLSPAAGWIHLVNIYIWVFSLLDLHLN